MKIWYLIASLIQLVIGLAAIAAFVILAINGELMWRWIITLILALWITGLGVIGVVSYVKERKKHPKE